MSSNAYRFYQAADGHRRGAIALFPHIGNPKDGFNTVFLAFYNVLGFSLELYFKAFLSASGVSNIDLSCRPFGHNLENLFVAASEYGLTIQPSAIARLVEIIGPHHGEYSYRYVPDKGEKPYNYTYIDEDSFGIVLITLQQLHIDIGWLVDEDDSKGSS